MTSLSVNYRCHNCSDWLFHHLVLSQSSVEVFVMVGPASWNQLAQNLRHEIRRLSLTHCRKTFMFPRVFIEGDSPEDALRKFRITIIHSCIDVAS